MPNHFAKLNVLLVDDHSVMRDGLKAVLSMITEIGNVDEAENGKIAVEMAAGSNYDLLLMDISMPVMNGIEATREIIRKEPRTRIIAVTMHVKGNLLAEILRAGAMAYVAKDQVVKKLPLLIDRIVKGGDGAASASFGNSGS